MNLTFKIALDHNILKTGDLVKFKNQCKVGYIHNYGSHDRYIECLDSSSVREINPIKVNDFESFALFCDNKVDDWKKVKVSQLHRILRYIYSYLPKFVLGVNEEELDYDQLVERLMKSENNYQPLRCDIETLCKSTRKNKTKQDWISWCRVYDESYIDLVDTTRFAICSEHLEALMTQNRYNYNKRKNEETIHALGTRLHPDDMEATLVFVGISSHKIYERRWSFSSLKAVSKNLKEYLAERRS